ncbi:MAG: EamA family transporter [Gammaproteobacteria bacterium]
MNRRGLREGLLSPGVLAALVAAALFGGATPFAKHLLFTVDPWLLAGLLYAGSGIALTMLRVIRPLTRSPVTGQEWFYLSGSVISGGIIAPVLLMKGLLLMPASGASLLLNAEGVLTAVLAWFAFRENFDRRIALGMLAIAAAAMTLTWTPPLILNRLGPALLILCACLAWALDNNLTRKVALLDATWLAWIKGLVAGTVNLLIALSLGARWPASGVVAAALLIGALGYGVSLVLFVVGLRDLGAARTSAYFSIAPFVGALGGLIWLHEPVTIRLMIAGSLMALGVWLHLTEKHEHSHDHPVLQHDHEHVHDAHHQHVHDVRVAPGTRHRHVHRHDPLSHSHHHTPDAHHPHDHDSGVR